MCAKARSINTKNNQFKSKFEKIAKLYSYSKSNGHDMSGLDKVYPYLFKGPKTLDRIYPYLGEKFVKKTMLDERDHPEIRKVLVVDSFIRRNYCSVEEQVKDGRNPLSPKNYLREFESLIDLDDIVCHCFMMRPIDGEIDTKNIFKKNFVVGENPKRINEFLSSNEYGITPDELHESVDVLIHVINWCKPNLIFVLGNSMWELINDSFSFFKKKSFDEICREARIICHKLDLSNGKYDKNWHKKWWLIPPVNFVAHSDLEKLLSPDKARREKLDRILESLDEIRNETIKMKKIIQGNLERYGYEEDPADLSLYEDDVFNSDEFVVEGPIDVEERVKIHGKYETLYKKKYKVDHLFEEIYRVNISLYVLKLRINVLVDLTAQREPFQKIAIDGSLSQDRRRNNKFSSNRKKK